MHVCLWMRLRKVRGSEDTGLDLKKLQPFETLHRDRLAAEDDGHAVESDVVGESAGVRLAR